MVTSSGQICSDCNRKLRLLPFPASGVKPVRLVPQAGFPRVHKPITCTTAGGHVDLLKEDYQLIHHGDH